VTGIYTNNFDAALNTKNGFPVFATLIEANFIHKKEDLFSAYKLTDEDKHEVLKMSKDPRIGQRVSQHSDSWKGGGRAIVGRLLKELHFITLTFWIGRG
jgi:hypothetical protein